MKWSKYNILFKSKKHGYLIYNTLTNALASIEPETYKLFENLKNENLNINDINNNELKTQLVDAKFIVENDEVEFLKLKYAKQKIRFRDDWLGLTIAPTLHCNFACIYCFEKSRPPIYMTDNIEEALISFIKGKNPNNLKLTWYGGEPLMDFKRIKSITKKIKELDFGLHVKIISNGYLITKKKVTQFEKLNIKSIQITLDGMRETHDNRRPLVNGKGTFDKIVENIGILKEYTNNDFNIYIRVNLDKSNENEYNLLFKYLHKRFNFGKMNIYPGFVDDESNSCASTDNCYLDRQQKAKFKINLYKKHGIAGNNTFFPMTSQAECMARGTNSFLIDANGYIYKCWKDINVSEKRIGHLQEDSLNENLLVKYNSGADPLEDENCKNCIHFPICGGGCTYYRLENKFNNGNFDLCYDAKDNLAEYLELHAEIKNKKKNNK